MKTLRVLREARGWSRAKLAREAGLNAVTVGAIEAGRLAPYPGQLSKLARAIGVAAGEAATLVEEVAGDAAIAEPVPRVDLDRSCARGRNS
jgi:transcriptional regulator with XRE-family HTH domain